MVEYMAPKSLEDAIKALTVKKGKKVILSGGQVVTNQIVKGTLFPDTVLDITRIPELKEIRIEENGVFLGACLTHTDILNNHIVVESLPAFYQAAGTIGDLQVRNRATIGGTICDANLSGDYWGGWYLTNALVWIRSKNNLKKVPIKELVKGQNKLYLKSDELILGIEIPKIHNSLYIKFYLKSRQMLGVTIVNEKAAITGINEYPIIIDLYRTNITELFDYTSISKYKKYKISMVQHILNQFKGGLKDENRLI